MNERRWSIFRGDLQFSWELLPALVSSLVGHGSPPGLRCLATLGGWSPLEPDFPCLVRWPRHALEACQLPLLYREWCQPSPASRSLSCGDVTQRRWVLPAIVSYAIPVLILGTPTVSRLWKGSGLNKSARNSIILIGLAGIVTAFPGCGFYCDAPWSAGPLALDPLYVPIGGRKIASD